jgi:hypothetical protein
VTTFDFSTAAELFAARGRLPKRQAIEERGLPAPRTPSGPQSKRFHPNFLQAPTRSGAARSGCLSSTRRGACG